MSQVAGKSDRAQPERLRAWSTEFPDDIRSNCARFRRHPSAERLSPGDVVFESRSADQATIFRVTVNKFPVKSRPTTSK